MQPDIVEDEPLLIKADSQPPMKTMSLNTGMTPYGGANVTDAGGQQPVTGGTKKAMTYMPRGLSLATRANIDPIALVEQARENSKNPMKLSWENVQFEAEVKASPADRKNDPTLGSIKTLKIVKNVSGYAAPGQATFIMGSSGAGKTSLLNILADRVTSATNTRLSGNVLFNDAIPVNKDTFQKYAAYVMQDDVLFANFTVREALTFAARLKLKTSEEQQNALVERIINDLGMSHISSSFIGSVEKKVLSGGERKRASIGVELVSDPSVILLDEPTSGLDAFKAQSICKLLHDLARSKGMTVVSTIHSPSSEAFFYFDRLILMCDGNIVYQGDAKNSVQHFKQIGFPPPQFANPADFFMKVLSVRYPIQTEDQEKIDKLNRNYRSLIEKQVKAEGRLIRLTPPNQQNEPNHKADVSVQINQLMSRSWILAKREPRLSRAKVLQCLVMIFLMLGTFWQVDDFSNANSVQDMAGAIYYLTIVQMQFNFQPTIVVFQSEKPVYCRERDSGMYDIWVYATTKLLAEVPITALVPLLFNLTIYFSAGMTTAFGNWVQFYVILFMMVEAAMALGYFLSAFFNHESTALAFAPILNMPLNLLSGFMINLNGIMHKFPQATLAWMMFISPQRYGFSALMNVQFPTPCSDIDAEEFYQGDDSKCEFQDDEVVYSETVAILEQYGIDDKNYWGALGGLTAVFVFFRIMVILVLFCQDRGRGRVTGDTRNTNIVLPPHLQNRQ